ncbi:MAG: ABC transporter substrate-binding protein [Gordonia sp. (in: high G+C Gram-positive bacteria)]
MVRSRFGRGLAACVTVLALLSSGLLVAGCSTAPIDTGKSVDPSTVLRDGPQTATLPDTDVAPVEKNPPVSARAQRIIALDINGTLGNIVFALGLGPHVVGRDQSTTFASARDLPLVTENSHAINAEKVLAQNPSIVLAGQDATPSGVLDQLRASGIDVVTFTSERIVSGTPKLIRDVAAALDVQAAGEKLVARTQQQIDQAKRDLPSPTGDPTMAFVYIRGEHLILLAGPGSGADDLIGALGGRDAGTAAGLTGAFTMVSTESMMRANPAVILVMTQGADSVGGIDGVLKLPAVAGTDAGRHRRIVQMDETQMLAFGPDVGLVLGALGKAIYR